MSETMLFGRKNLFAIEAMSEPDLRPPSAVWGRMQVWCEGENIGDYTEQYCALYSAYCGFKHLSKGLPQLWSHELDGLSDIDLWNHFDGLLYSYHGDTEIHDDRTLEQCQSDWERWGEYNFLTNWGEQFDNGGKSFILCKPDNVVWVLNRSRPPERGISFRAPLNETLAAMRQYIEWFQDESARLGVPADT